MPSHKYTNEQIAAAFREKNFVKTHTARKLGMTVQNLHYLINTREGLKKMLDEAMEERLDIAESALLDLVKDKNFLAVKLVLESLGRKRGYGNRIEVSHVNESEKIMEALDRKYADDL